MIRWCDLECKEEGIFLKHERNEVEILLEFEYVTPISRTTRACQSWEATGSLYWTLIDVYEEGNNKEDVELLSSSPSCLYYNVKYWDGKWEEHITDVFGNCEPRNEVFRSNEGGRRKV